MYECVSNNVSYHIIPCPQEIVDHNKWQLGLLAWPDLKKEIKIIIIRNPTFINNMEKWSSGKQWTVFIINDSWQKTKVFSLFPFTSVVFLIGNRDLTHHNPTPHPTHPKKKALMGLIKKYWKKEYNYKINFLKAVQLETEKFVEIWGFSSFLFLSFFNLLLVLIFNLKLMLDLIFLSFLKY